jgi:hypothetical protein
VHEHGRARPALLDAAQALGPLPGALFRNDNHVAEDPCPLSRWQAAPSPPRAKNARAASLPKGHSSTRKTPSSDQESYNPIVIIPPSVISSQSMENVHTSDARIQNC